jgi:hypothetical protein
VYLRVNRRRRRVVVVESLGKVQGDTVGGDIEVAGVTGKFTGKRVRG